MFHLTQALPSNGHSLYYSTILPVWRCPTGHTYSTISTYKTAVPLQRWELRKFVGWMCMRTLRVPKHCFEYVTWDHVENSALRWVPNTFPMWDSKSNGISSATTMQPCFKRKAAWKRLPAVLRVPQSNVAHRCVSSHHLRQRHLHRMTASFLCLAHQQPSSVFASPALPITLGYDLGGWRWTGVGCVCTCSLAGQTSGPESEDGALVSRRGSLSVSIISAIGVVRATLGQSGWNSSAGVMKEAWTLYHVLLGQCFPICSVYLTGGWHMPPFKCLS